MHLLIGIDLDAIIVDLVRPWLRWWNQRHGRSVTIDDVTTFVIEDHTGPDAVEFFDDVENYSNCPILPGAAEGLRELADAGHDLVITTASMGGRTAEVKWDLVHKAAPWLSRDNVMAGMRKELLRFDVFIDDAPHNIRAYREAWPDAKILTIAYPYNQEVRGRVNCFADGHNDTTKAWRQLVDYVDVSRQSWHSLKTQREPNPKD